MDSVEVLAVDREEEEVAMGRDGLIGMKIGSVTRIKVGNEHMGLMGEDEIHIANQAKDIISS